jgi:hypothetical protein
MMPNRLGRKVELLDDCVDNCLPGLAAGVDREEDEAMTSRRERQIGVEMVRGGIAFDTVDPDFHAGQGSGDRTHGF